MSVQYIGPDATFIRKIDDDSGFPDDPDWFAVATTLDETALAAMWSTPNVRRGTMAPLTHMIVSFVFLDVDNEEVKGGTTDIYAFYVNDPNVYGKPQGSRPVVRKTGSKTGHNLDTDLVVEVTKHPLMGVRLSNITAPVGAVTLRIAVQELA